MIGANLVGWRQRGGYNWGRHHGPLSRWVKRDLGRGGLEAHAIRTRIENVFLSRVVLTSTLTHWCVRKKINVCEMCSGDIDTALCLYRCVISPAKVRTATTVTRGWKKIAPTVAHDPRRVHTDCLGLWPEAVSYYAIRLSS